MEWAELFFHLATQIPTEEVTNMTRKLHPHKSSCGNSWKPMENSYEQYSSYVLVHPQQLQNSVYILQELEAAQSQNGPVEMFCGDCESQVEYELEYMAVEKDADVTLEGMQKNRSPG